MNSDSKFSTLLAPSGVEKDCFAFVLIIPVFQ